MKADPAAQLRLLDLQAADTAAAQLAHRRRTLPELAVIEDCAKRAGELAIESGDLQARIDDVAAEQTRLEKDIEMVRARRSRDDSRLAGGGLPSKELESLQHEVATLDRRQATLEDELLEVMEQREDLDVQAAQLAERRAELDTQRETAEHSRDQVFGEIDAALEQRRADRERVAAGLPADLLALYEKVRQQTGGVGAAALRQRRCEGCRIELSGHDLAAARSAAADDVLRCDNCRRILVRTAESGL
jgi:predicted  nucleic acid-binding Zn-ribbon protein